MARMVALIVPHLARLSLQSRCIVSLDGKMSDVGFEDVVVSPSASWNKHRSGCNNTSCPTCGLPSDHHSLWKAYCLTALR